MYKCDTAQQCGGYMPPCYIAKRLEKSIKDERAMSLEKSNPNERARHKEKSIA